MTVPLSNTRLRAPKGFQNLMEGFSREVLRSQPKNVYSFGLQYFENALRARDSGDRDPATHGAKMEDIFYNNNSFKEPLTDVSNPQQQTAALTIQTNYRQHAAEEKVQDMRQEEAAVKIQAGIRGYIDRQKVRDRNATKQQQDKPIFSKDTKESLNQQANGGLDEVDIDLNDPNTEKAAVKIQAGFRGYKVRKAAGTDAPASQDQDENKVKEEQTQNSQEQVQGGDEVEQSGAN